MCHLFQAPWSFCNNKSQISIHCKYTVSEAKHLTEAFYILNVAPPSHNDMNQENSILTLVCVFDFLQSLFQQILAFLDFPLLFSSPSQFYCSIIRQANIKKQQKASPMKSQKKEAIEAERMQFCQEMLISPRKICISHWAESEIISRWLKISDPIITKNVDYIFPTECNIL